MTIPIEPAACLATGKVAIPIRPLHVVSALIRSSSLSTRTGHNVFLKLDCDQPSGSFKIRGIGAICQMAIAQHGAENTHLVSSSGGNAGLAVAHAAKSAGVGCTIFVPLSTEADVVEKLRLQGAEVVVGGDAWDQADAAARVEVESRKASVYVHPFEGDQLIAGHSGMVDEVFDQLQNVDVLISSVGGGGLLRGIMHGVKRRGKESETTLVAVQNFGVDSFNRSLDRYLSQKDQELPNDVVTLSAIESKCTSMGTTKCSLTTLHDAINFTRTNGEITTLTVTDRLSESACWQFARHECADGKTRKVELSCASALAPVYHPWILDRLIEASGRLKQKVEQGTKLNVLVEVCGGSKVNDVLLDEYERQAGLMEHGDTVRVNGVDFPSKSG